jgi:hypothetical protein
MKLRRPSNHAVFEEGDDKGAVACAFFGITLDEAVVHETVKTVMATLTIEPQ